MSALPMHAVPNGTAPFALVVDDDPTTLMLVGAMLDHGGYTHHAVQSFDDARRWLERGPVVVILDLIMPDETSERLVEHMARHYADVPLLLMSSRPRDELERRREELTSRGLSVPAVLPKPFWLDPLLEALAAALARPMSDAGTALLGED